MARAKTQNLGAQRERDCIRAKVRRMQRQGFSFADAALADLMKWLNARSKRFRAKAGGLG